jgi:hypothetical protein
LQRLHTQSPKRLQIFESFFVTTCPNATGFRREKPKWVYFRLFPLICESNQIFCEDLGRAKAHLHRATKAGKKFDMMALDDPNLEPLQGSLGAE